MFEKIFETIFPAVAFLTTTMLVGVFIGVFAGGVYLGFKQGDKPVTCEIVIKKSGEEQYGEQN